MAELNPDLSVHLVGTDDPEVRVHLGFWSEEELLVSQPLVATTRVSRPTRFTNALGGGGGFALLAVAKRVSFEEDLKRAARQAADLARDLQMHQWVGGVLSASGRDVTTDTAVAEVLLERLQVEGSAPLVRVAQLAAGLVALGFHVFVVGHDGAKPLTAVYVDGQWAYADPTTQLPFGGHRPFTRERFYRIPDLPDPPPSMAEQELQRIREEMRRAQEALAEAEQLLSDQLQSLETSVEVCAELREEADRLRAYLVVGAVALTVTVWLLLAQSREDG